MNLTATYSPDDNKLRLYASSRLDSELYARVRAAGFIWAPKQDLFVAPMWTPDREDLLLELCGEITDEDTSLTERAEDRAERFEDYSDKRAQDAQQAQEAVERITDGIPLGQPILVGHHSEKHARKDAERIENGMRRTIRLWETSQYWVSRAQGAIGHAKYKERPDVRARRIKGLEADERKKNREKSAAEKSAKAWRAITETPDTFRRKDGQPTTLYERARFVANFCHVSKSFPLAQFPRNPPASQYEGSMSLWSALGDSPEQAIVTPEQAQEIALRAEARVIAWAERWLTHYANRLAYERAMLSDGGGTVATRTGPEKGGACRCWASPRGGWSYIQKVNKVSVTVLDNWGNGGRNFTRTIPFDKLAAVLTAAEVSEKRAKGELFEVAPCPDGTVTGFVLRESAPVAPKEDLVCPDGAPCPDTDCQAERTKQGLPVIQAPDLTAMRATLKAGVTVVAAPQLFPTPRDLAERMVSEADIQPGDAVLEPSAGTGRLIGAMGGRMFAHEPERGSVVAVEVNPALAEALRREFPLTTVRCSDFLETVDERGFDRIVMNPPFERGSDIAHIKHALTMLKPGGKLVALCANGPRQQEALRPLATEWEELPEGTFKEQGTGVRVALMTVEA